MQPGLFARRHRREVLLMLLAVKGGTIVPVSSDPIPDGVMLIDNGKIQVVGVTAEVRVPGDAKVIKAAGKYVLPGLVDAHAHVGLWSEHYGQANADGNEGSGPITPEVRAIDAVWPEHTSFADARSGGVTTLQTTPGSGNAIGGEMLVVKTDTVGKTVEDIVLRCPSGMKAALGENVKRYYGQTLKKAPMTRMGAAALIRQAFYKARDYQRKLEAGQDDSSKLPDTDLGLDQLLRVLRREMPLRIHAHRADDIVTAVRLAEEFDLDYSIEHCTDGAAVADFLGRRGARVNMGPTFGYRSKIETRALHFRNAGILAAAGCKVSIMTDHPFVSIDYLMMCAAMSCAQGMPEAEALRAVTLTPAETLGVAERVGSFDAGKDADFAIWSGHPFKIRSRPEQVYVEGRLIHEI
jgi:imidazolonepropionase-like amidohydrolase